ncbi:MAG: serine/threonine protein kinase [Thermoanaerobaculia bacterium]|nr:serine/threonine protein kinase [Thermoanaerobaculia bacterium]
MSSPQSGARTASEEEVPTSAGVRPSVSRQAADERRLFRTGDKISNRYRILRYIARGGMGEVYAALDAELGQPVALKAVRPEVAQHSQTLRRFRREINLSRKVTHRNVCRIYDVGTHHSEEQALSIRYLTMELLEGSTLTRYLRKRGRLSPDEALPIVVQIASGLGAAHDAGVVHRDFKTSNVLLAETTRGLRAVVMDFGLSQTLSEDGKTPMDSDKLTSTGQLMGTLAYLAPEQLEGKPSSAATDVYALGVVLYQMLTGHLPFDGGSPLMVALKRLHEEPPDPRKFVPDLDPAWCEIALRCLERDVARRFQDIEEFLSALGVEALTESSTSITRPIVQHRRGLGTDTHQVVPAAKAVPEPGGSDEVPLPKGALAYWKALALTAFAALLVLGIVHFAPLLGTPPEIRVLVTEPTVVGDDSDLVAANLEAEVLSSLAALEGVQSVDSSEARGVRGPSAELLRRVDADELLQLEVRDAGNEWGVTLKRIGPDGRVLFVENFLVPRSDPHSQAAAVRSGVRRAFSERASNGGTSDRAGQISSPS